jgi:hypothetical protein
MNIMTHLISIPKPCNENWNTFTPAEQGRHCQTCAKTVIDFTTWEPQAISNYLINKKNEETCGRFYKTQIVNEIPSATDFTKKIAHFKISTLKKIAAIFLFAFFIDNSARAQSNMLMGEPAPLNQTTVTVKKAPIKKVNKKVPPKQTKAICDKEMVMGKMIMPVSDSANNKVKKIVTTPAHPTILMGAPAITPINATNKTVKVTNSSKTNNGKTLKSKR